MSLCQLHCVWNSRLFTYETCLHHLPLPSVGFIFASGLHWTDRHRKALINLRNALTCLLFAYIVFSLCASSALCFTSSSFFFFPCLASSASSLITSFFWSSFIQSDLLHRECPRSAGAWPGLQSQPAVLPGQLRRRLQGQVLGRP